MQKVKSQSRLIKEITDFYEVFLETEQELFRRKTAGIRYWHYIRFDFFNELLNGKKWIEKIDHHEHRTLLMKVGIATNLLKNSLLHGVRKDKSKDDVLVLSSAKKNRRVAAISTLILIIGCGKCDIHILPGKIICSGPIENTGSNLVCSFWMICMYEQSFTDF